MKHPANCSRDDHSNYNEWIRCIQRRKRRRIARENAKPIRKITVKTGAYKSSIQLLFGENGFEALGQPK